MNPIRASTAAKLFMRMAPPSRSASTSSMASLTRLMSASSLSQQQQQVRAAATLASALKNANRKASPATASASNASLETLESAIEGSSIEALASADIEADRILAAEDDPTIPTRSAADSADKQAAAISEFYKESNEIVSNVDVHDVASLKGAFERLMQMRAFGGAFGVLQKMKAAGVDVTVEQYAVAMDCVRRALRPAELREIFGEPLPYANEDGAKEPSSEAKTGWIVEARQVKEWMAMDGITLPSKFYEDLAGQLMEQGHTGVLLNIAMTMERKDIQPTVTFYNRMLAAMQKSGMRDRAGHLFARMHESGLADLITYLTRVDGFVAMRDWRAAQEAWMVLAEKYPTASMPTAAGNLRIRMLLQQDRLSEAISVLDAMRLQPVSKSDNISHCTGVDNATARPFLMHFIRAFEEDPQKASKATMDAAARFSKETIPELMSVSTFPEEAGDFALLARFWALYEPKRVLKVLEDARTKGIPMHHDALIDAMLLVTSDARVPGEWKTVFVTEGLLARKSTPNKNVLIDLVGEHVRPSTRAILGIAPESFRPSVSTVHNLLKSFMQTGNWPAARSLFAGLYNTEGGRGRMRNTRETVCPANDFRSDSNINVYLTALLRLGDVAEAEKTLTDIIPKVKRAGQVFPMHPVVHLLFSRQGIDTFPAGIRVEAFRTDAPNAKNAPMTNGQPMMRSFRPANTRFTPPNSVNGGKSRADYFDVAGKGKKSSMEANEDEQLWTA